MVDNDLRASGEAAASADGYRPLLWGLADGKARAAPETGRGETALERSGRSGAEGGARSALAASNARGAARPKTPQGSLERAIASEG